MGMASKYDLARISDSVYSETGAPAGWNRLSIPSLTNDAGYYGAAFRNDATGEIVVAHRGTEALSFDGDWTSNIQMGRDRLPDQYQYAREFLDRVQRDNAGAEVTITGHSLGGALAQLTAAETGLNATTFNPYGANDLIPALNERYGLNLDPNGTYDNISNYRALFDPVSVLPGSTQIGNMQTHVAPSEVPVSVLGIGILRLPIAIGAVGFWSHGIGRFEEIFNSPDDSDGNPAGSLDLELGIEPGTHSDFLLGRNWFPRRDPLTLDLDGDGLETVGIDTNNPILFDHDGDGVKNATGWIKPDDGFLVLDRDGNGLIDNGTELFGDSTPLSTGGNAADGFAALVDQDTNHDGLVNAQDANWNELRVWKDANGDAITDAGELHTLDELNIVGFHTTKTEHTSNLANGNQIEDLGSYIKGDGSEAIVGNATGGIADINLADNPFYRTFPDTLDTSAVATLPDMQGSGSLRDLREAASTSAALAGAVAGYAAADTRAGQLAAADNLIREWSHTTGFQTSVEKALDSHFKLYYVTPGLTYTDLLLADGTLAALSSSGSGSGGSGSLAYGQGFVLDPPDKTAALAEHARIVEMLGILERFNGLTFVNIEPAGARTGANQLIGIATSTGGSGGSSGAVGGFVFDASLTQPIAVTLSSTQINFLNSAYISLKQSVYDGLLLQTRLKPYLDAVSLTITDTGIGMDFSGVDAAFQTRYQAAPADAVRDLLDLQRIVGGNLNGLGWDGYGQLRNWIGDAATNTDFDAATRSALMSSLVAGLTDFGYPGLVTTGNRTDIGLDGKRRLKSRRWWDGDVDVVCANGTWRAAA